MLTPHLRPRQAFVSYLRSVYLQKDKSVFKLDELPVEKFSESLGLPGMPKIKFLSKEMAKRKKNSSRAVAAVAARPKAEDSEQDDESDEGSESSGEDSEDEHDEPAAEKASEKVLSNPTPSDILTDTSFTARSRAY